jgi:NAD(P)-dependent dehydrogenase (short-subunit alcohol dehydrogenase family)
MTSSSASWFGRVQLDDLEAAHGTYRSMRVYGTTKLENILMAREIARQWTTEGITATAFHPGIVATQFGRDSRIAHQIFGGVFKGLLRTPEQAAQTLVWLASAPLEELVNGGYYKGRRVAKTTAQANDAALAQALWEQSAELVNSPAGLVE